MVLTEGGNSALSGEVADFLKKLVNFNSQKSQF